MPALEAKHVTGRLLLCTSERAVLGFWVEKRVAQVHPHPQMQQSMLSCSSMGLNIAPVLIVICTVVIVVTKAAMVSAYGGKGMYPSVTGDRMLNTSLVEDLVLYHHF